MAEGLIELRHVSKPFAGILALDKVSLIVHRGEIHRLAGENGSGKSTIIKIMSGVYQPDEGELLIDGEPVKHLTPAASVQRGIQVIYQDLSLFGNLSVAENLAVNGYLRERRKTVRWSETRKVARSARPARRRHTPGRRGRDFADLGKAARGDRPRPDGRGAYSSWTSRPAL
jgi:simple sugar transport system ATP-binding protein